MAFCPGCGRHSLRELPAEFGKGYESPCTMFAGKDRAYIVNELKHLDTSELNQVLEFYEYSKEGA